MSCARCSSAMSSTSAATDQQLMGAAAPSTRSLLDLPREVLLQAASYLPAGSDMNSLLGCCKAVHSLNLQSDNELRGLWLVRTKGPVGALQAAVMAPDGGSSAQLGDLGLVDLMLQRGWVRAEDITAHGKNGTTALNQAVFSGNTQLLQWLLRVPGLDVNARDARGDTALRTAVSWSRAAAVRLLLATPGIDANLLMTRDPQSNTAIHQAAAAAVKRRDAVRVLEVLLQAPGINANVADGSGHTPLHYVAIVRVDRVVGVSDDKPATPQDLARLVQLLVSAGCDVHRRNVLGQTARQVAEGYHDQVMAEVLRQAELHHA